MWLCLNDCFVSVVEYQPKGKPVKDMLMIRARRRKHLTNLLGKDAEIVANVGTDYKYRAYVKRDEFAKLIADKITNINYGNFKNSVIEPELHDLYADFWRGHYKYQMKEKKSEAEAF